MWMCEEFVVGVLDSKPIRCLSSETHEVGRTIYSPFQGGSRGQHSSKS